MGIIFAAAIALIAAATLRAEKEANDQPPKPASIEQIILDNQ